MELRGVEGQETVARMYCMREVSIFSKKLIFCKVFSSLIHMAIHFPFFRCELCDTQFKELFSYPSVICSLPFHQPKMEDASIGTHLELICLGPHEKPMINPTWFLNIILVHCHNPKDTNSCCLLPLLHLPVLNSSHFLFNIRLLHSFLNLKFIEEFSEIDKSSPFL